MSDDVDQELEHEPDVDAPPPAAAPAPAAGGERPGISWRDRVLVLSPTGGGKSVLLNHLFAGYRCQRVLVDTKDEFSIDGVEPVTRIERIDWAQPVIHFVDDRGDVREYNKLYRAFLQRRGGRGPGPRTYGLKVCCHEMGDLCGDNPGAAGPYVTGYYRKGRAHGQGADGGSQRPVNLPKVARTEAEHIIVMEREFDPDDKPVVAKCLGVSEPQLDALQAQARALGPYAYIWRPKLDPRKRLFIRPPLPAAAVHNGMVRGLQ